jgi:NDP-sugar pyrophosphorylase family protein
VILAGGKGTRLRPYTTVLPKPLVPIADRPILERIIRQLAKQGFERIDLSVGHLGSLIKAFLDHIEIPAGLEIEYCWEDEPLGTAGPLKLIPELDEPFIAMNGDILTNIDYAEMLRAHESSEAALTIATRNQTVDVDLGVIESANGVVTEFREKPKLNYDVSMGIYAYAPSALDVIPDGRFDFPDVVRALMADGRKVATFSSPEGVWFDIGTISEHERASSEVEAHPELFEEGGSADA